MNQTSLPICEGCGFVFVPRTTWQRYCDTSCRSTLLETRHCRGCGVELTGKQRLWCGRQCRSRQYLRGSALLRCTAPGCPRAAILMVQRLRKSAAAVECAACGQLTPISLLED